MDIYAIIERMIILFLLMLVGFLANRAGLMNAQFNKSLSGLVINLTTPATILSSVLGGERALTNLEVCVLLLIAVVSYGLMVAISLPVPALLRAKTPGDGALLRFMMIFSNVGFMGFPVVSALFGEGAVFYAAIFNMPFNLLLYSYGIKLVSGGRTGGVNKKTLLSPCVLASLLAIILYFLSPDIPEVITVPLGYLSDITVPAAMLILGSSLAMLPLGDIFRGWRIYALSGLKLLVVPVLVFLIMQLLPVQDIMRQVTVVMWAMPVATNASMLATQYGGDEALASKGVLITTLLSIVTIPVLMALLFLS